MSQNYRQTMINYRQTMINYRQTMKSYRQTTINYRQTMVDYRQTMELPMVSKKWGVTPYNHYFATPISFMCYIAICLIIVIPLLIVLTCLTFIAYFSRHHPQASNLNILRILTHDPCLQSTRYD